MSTAHPVKSGVPQGSVLSPLLFSVLLYDIPELANVRMLMQADDITLFVTGKSIEESQNLLQKAVTAIWEWTVRWGLELNPGKSKLMCFTKKRVDRIPEIKINNIKVPFVTKHFFGCHF